MMTKQLRYAAVAMETAVAREARLECAVTEMGREVLGHDGHVGARRATCHGP